MGPTRYKWSSNPYKWGSFTPLLGTITPFVTGRGPPNGASNLAIIRFDIIDIQLMSLVKGCQVPCHRNFGPGRGEVHECHLSGNHDVRLLIVDSNYSLWIQVAARNALRVRFGG